MTEQQAISDKHANIVQSLYATFYDGYLEAKNAAEKKKVEQKFIEAVKTARDARDRAIIILPA